VSVDIADSVIRDVMADVADSHGIQVVRHTFEELASIATLSSSPDRLLLIPNPLLPNSPPNEIGVVYYRAGYTPTDYTSTTAWKTRLMLERSKAIKCPSLALQLAGAKKVQQVLAEEGMVERFLCKGDDPVSQGVVDRLRETFTGLYPMDNSPLGQEAYRLAVERSEGFVLKPQREGGGNNIYRENIPPFLESLELQPLAPGEPPRREGYILMSLIDPPKELKNLLVKGGSTIVASGEVVSELGVYGVALFDGSLNAEIAVNRNAGTLLRTKGRESDEGGVAVGYSVIDSVLLV